MYLARLYKQSRLWFLVVVLFIAGQLFFDYKNGVECSPFYHYSMFSIRYHFLSTYYTTEVSINGNPLQSKDFTPNGWDNLVIPITQYKNQQDWNSTLYHSTINRLLPVTDSLLYVNTLSQTEFDRWYKQRLVRLLRLADTTTNIQYKIVPYQQTNGLLHR